MKKRLFCSLLLIINILLCMAQTMQKHTVKRGETLASIAQSYGITVAELREANPDMGEYFYVGMVLNVPEKKVVSTKPINETSTNYAQPFTVPQSTATSYTSNTKTSNISYGNKGTWDVTGRFGWFSRAYSKGDDMNGFGLSFLMGANYFFEDQAFLKFCVGYALSSKRKDNTSADLNSIRLPISINYLFPFGKSGGFTIGVGPYFDYAVSGKSEYNSHGYKMKMKFSEIDGSHAMVFGLHVCASLMFSTDWGLYGEYGFGLNKRYTDIREDYWSVGLAYGF